jgi:hypothetical protein
MFLPSRLPLAPRSSSGLEKAVKVHGVASSPLPLVFELQESASSSVLSLNQFATENSH